jgi:surface antigen
MHTNLAKPTRFKTAGVVLALAGMLTLGACDTAHYGPKTTMGGLAGAGLGALAGTQIGHGRGQLAAVGAGTLIGALIGGSIGRSLDRADQYYAQQATYQALESGSSIAWNNPESGNYGTVAPVETYRAPSGAYCREYQQTIYVGGRAQQGYGTACQQPDGSWQVVN